MYPNCNCQNSGMGFLPELIGAAASMFTGGSDGASGAGAAAAPITVSPQISTQISPQISPVFQQQFQPQNSAATAGTSQSLPGMPSLTSGPNGPATSYPAGYSPVGAPSVAVPSVPVNWAQYLPYILGGVGLVVAYKVFSKSKYAKA
jgi:hypothetical protein